MICLFSSGHLSQASLLSLLLCLCVDGAEVEIFAKKNPKQILRRLEAFLKERRTRIGHRASPDSLSHSNRSPSDRGSSLGTQGTKEGKEMNFTGVCELPAEMEGEARLI